MPGLMSVLNQQIEGEPFHSSACYTFTSFCYRIHSWKVWWAVVYLIFFCQI